VSSVATTQETYDRFEAWLRENGAKFNMVSYVSNDFRLSSNPIACCLGASNNISRKAFCSLDRLIKCMNAESRKGTYSVCQSSILCLVLNHIVCHELCL
jgi:hypothetical protein